LQYRPCISQQLVICILAQGVSFSPDIPHHLLCNWVPVSAVPPHWPWLAA
jgi:hypothetical protein